MHDCPECGYACYCHGDIDDCVVETEEYSAKHCTHYLECCRDEDREDEPDYFEPVPTEPPAESAA